jgi:hypothetical protein
MMLWMNIFLTFYIMAVSGKIPKHKKVRKNASTIQVAVSTCNSARVNSM